MKTILVAEDDSSVRLFSTCVLKERGFNVLEAGSGEEALAVYERFGREIDLLFTDLQMPYMNGAGLADLLEARQPGLKSLFTSGCQNGMVQEILQYRAPYRFLPKPYGLMTLIEAIQEVLKPTEYRELSGSERELMVGQRGR